MRRRCGRPGPRAHAFFGKGLLRLGKPRTIDKTAPPCASGRMSLAEGTPSRDPGPFARNARTPWRGTEHWSGTRMSKHCDVCNRPYPDDMDACPYCAEALEISEADV